jgi:hypothetical protein
MMTADAVAIQSQPTMRLESHHGRERQDYFLCEDTQGVGVIKLPPEWTWQVEPIKKILGTLQLPGTGTLADPPRPRVVPLGTGGIQLEWKNGQRELEVECGQDGLVEILKIEGDAEGESSPARTPADVISLFAWLMAA